MMSSQSNISNSAPNDDDANSHEITSLWYEAQNHYRELTNNPPDDQEQRIRSIEQCIYKLKSIAHLLVTESLINPKYDELDDISTDTLSYILSYYYIADLYFTMPSDIHIRYTHLLHGLAALNKYIELSINIYLFNDKREISQWKEYKKYLGNIMKNKSMNNNGHSSILVVPLSRQEKINRYKAEKEITQKLQYINEKRSKDRNALDRSNTIQGNHNKDDENNLIDHDIERQYIILLHQQYIITSINHAYSSIQEIQLLDYKSRQDGIDELERDMMNASLDFESQSTLHNDNNNKNRNDSNTSNNKSDMKAKSTLGESMADANINTSRVITLSKNINSSNLPVYRLNSSDDLNKPIPANMQKYLQHIPQQQHTSHNTSAQQFNSIVEQHHVTPSNSVNNIVSSGLSDLDKRRNIISTAFTDRNPATMTPEQWAEQQINAGLLAKPLVQSHNTRKDKQYINGSNDECKEEDKDNISDDDENELDDKTHDAMQFGARQWDNWKDDHEKGEGARKLRHR